ncbi:MAG: DnaJ domain-containing protein [Candidatus Muirbacterium halophilum]|nr:DnaJ domain-containing protein [Candidatus Muirbacterium halophilum]MCK9474674.1 DnaJ domain-containing protein [Candidatus Muirbacterium halophilum]
MLDNAYNILGVNKDSDINTIKRVFREKVKIYHPDLNKNISSEKFRNIVDSYNIIINTRQRKINIWDNIGELYFYIIKNFLKDIYITINQKEFINKKIFSFYANEYCDMCRSSETFLCMKCSGKGYNLFKSGNYITRVLCGNCHGRGKVFLCKKCNGKGKIKIKKIINKNTLIKVRENVFKVEKFGNKFKDYFSDVYIRVEDNT